MKNIILKNIGDCPGYKIEDRAFCKSILPFLHKTLNHFCSTSEYDRLFFSLHAAMYSILEKKEEGKEFKVLFWNNKNNDLTTKETFDFICNSFYLTLEEIKYVSDRLKIIGEETETPVLFCREENKFISRTDSSEAFLDFINSFDLIILDAIDFLEASSFNKMSPSEAYALTSLLKESVKKGKTFILLTEDRNTAFEEFYKVSYKIENVEPSSKIWNITLIKDSYCIQSLINSRKSFFTFPYPNYFSCFRIEY